MAVNASKIEARFKDSVLHVTLAKTEDAKDSALLDQLVEVAGMV